MSSPLPRGKRQRQLIGGLIKSSKTKRPRLQYSIVFKLFEFYLMTQSLLIRLKISLMGLAIYRTGKPSKVAEL
jgi:hypothetical protein